MHRIGLGADLSRELLRVNLSYSVTHWRGSGALVASSRQGLYVGRSFHSLHLCLSILHFVAVSPCTAG